MTRFVDIYKTQLAELTQKKNKIIPYPKGKGELL